MSASGARPRTDLTKRAAAICRRVAYFLVAWSGLLFLHESGHAWVAARQGRVVQHVQVGLGPTLWRGDVGGRNVSFRLVPVAGMTRVAPASGDDASLVREGAMFGAGIASTLLVAMLMVVLVSGFERGLGRRCVLGRMIAADAVVLTVFNFLPVPPLDGGRAALAAITAFRDTPLTDDALFWTHVSGLALASLPMVLWTSWTRRIDAVAMWWKAPRRPPSASVHG